MKPRAPVAALVTALAFAGAPGHRRAARADGLDDGRVNARSIARAGAVSVGDDGAAALVAAPAGLARRTLTRVSVGVAIRDYDGRHQFPSDGPRIDNQAPATAAPAVFLATGGDRWVAGASYTEAANRDVRTAEPAFGQPADQVVQLFPHRYGGTRLRYRRQTLTLGGAVRLGPWLALGTSASASRVTLRQSQALWAGFSGVAEVGDPSRDLSLELSGQASLVPGAAVGVLAIAGDTGFEFGAAAQVTGAATVEGEARLAPSGPQEFPRVTRPGGAATTSLPGHASLRAGARYAGSRFAVEVGGAYRWFDGPPAPWNADVAAQDQEALPPAPLGPIAGQLSLTDHWEAAAAAEVAVVPSFLWLVGSYSMRSRADRARLSRVTSTDGPLRTIGVGAEVFWREVTISAGYSRGFAPATDVGYDDTEVVIANPFDGGTDRVGAGRFYRSDDRFAISFEVAWDPLADDLAGPGDL